MEHVAPLLQTLLWVGLVAGIVWRFHNPIQSLLVALQQRIEAGGTIKAGCFELGELRPLNLAAQKEKVERELAELAQRSADPSQADVPKPALSSLQNRYFQAEDLALRALQAEYGVTISRQVTAGADSGFDGAFTLGGQLHVAEVAYSYHRINRQKVLSNIQRVSAAIQKYGWRNATIDLVLVADGQVIEGVDDAWLAKISERNVAQVIVHKYQMEDLQEQFGVRDNNVG